MIEVDLILMSLCIFLPSAFALVLLFFPKGSEEYMRWWTLFGTACTLVVSLFLFISYLKMMDIDLSNPQVTTLTERTHKMNVRQNAGEPRNSDDMVARFPWIPYPFNIDYFVGVDGISMSLILLTTVITFL